MNRREIPHLSLVSVAVLTVLLPAPAAAQGSRAKRAERFLQTEHDLRLFNGTALIVDAGQILFRGAFGFADFENEIPSQIETRFPISSPIAAAGPEDPGADGAASPETDHAVGYRKKLRGYERMPLPGPDTLSSAGTRYGTADDLLHWRERRPPQADGDRDDDGDETHVSRRAIGREDSVRVFQVSGETPGVSWLVRDFPDHHRTIVLLDNTSSDLTPVAEGLTNLLWGAEVRVPKPSIAERLLPVIESAGVDPALARYRDWKRTRPDQYDYGPDELMRLARHFREMEDPETATRILETEAEEFPSDARAAIALSELYAEADDPGRAVSRLETALLGDPGEPALLEALLSLGVEPAAALRSPVRQVAPEALARLVGEYRIDPTTTLRVQLEDEGLSAARTGEPAFPLLPQSETTFLIEGSEIQMIFQIERDEASAVSILESGQRVTFPRVPPER